MNRAWKNAEKQFLRTSEQKYYPRQRRGLSFACWRKIYAIGEEEADADASGGFETVEEGDSSVG
ncbi:MAG: hypothetical protein LUG17_05700 [Clostridiales bacterium]|nr:hypothetical protein [Clostridiales bacterium]